MSFHCHDLTPSDFLPYSHAATTDHRDSQTFVHEDRVDMMVVLQRGDGPLSVGVAGTPVAAVIIGDGA